MTYQHNHTLELVREEQRAYEKYCEKLRLDFCWLVFYHRLQYRGLYCVPFITEEPVTPDQILEKAKQHSPQTIVSYRIRGTNLYNAFFVQTHDELYRIKPDNLTIHHTTEWITAKSVLSGNRSKRTDVDHFDHVEEGVRILQLLEEPIDVQQAFALHPLFQSDEAMAKNWSMISKFDSSIMKLVMEYRRVANMGIRRVVSQNGWKITLSDIREVNKMLVADKIQNRKLFEEKFPKDNPECDELAKYFAVWLEALGVSEEQYQELVSQI